MHFSEPRNARRAANLERNIDENFCTAEVDHLITDSLTSLSNQENQDPLIEERKVQS